MLSLTLAHFQEPEFLRLSEHGQQHLRAIWASFEVLESEGGDRFQAGNPGPEFETEAMKAAMAEFDRTWALMTEPEAQELSAYAHRCDYPDMYDDGAMADSSNLAAFKTLMLEYLMKRSSGPLSEDEHGRFTDESVRLEDLLSPEDNIGLDEWIDEQKTRFPSNQTKEE